LLKGLLKNAGTLLGAGVAMMMNTYGTVIANQSANVIKAIGDTITTKKPEDALESLFALARKEASERKAFHDALAGLASTAGQLFIVIDELDRCNPAFAIDVLEVIKHYFDVPNVVFVFGIDMTQMAHAINGRYGGNMDAGGYLSKFFDHHIRLNTPTAKQMIHTVDEKRELGSRQEEDIERIFHACGVTPREIRNIFLKTRTLQETLDTFSWDKNQRAYVEIITMLFICMKYRKPNVYAAYMSSKGAWDYENWETGAPKIYDFLNRLSPYRTLMPDNAAEMLESCRRRKSSSLTDENDVLQAVGIFGIAVLGTRSGYYSKTFIQILQEWLESVAV